MENIIFVTGNHGKYVSARDKFAHIGVTVENINLDIEELEVSDVREVSLDKAKKAYEVLRQPCFVEDSGFYIETYPGKVNYPGTLVKRTGISSNIEELLYTMQDVENRNCYWLSCITFYDGENFHQFTEKEEGTLSKEIKGEMSEYARSRLWQVYIPKGSNKTLSELYQEGDYKNYNKKSPTESFVKWYSDNLSVKFKTKIKK